LQNLLSWKTTFLGLISSLFAWNSSLIGWWLNHFWLVNKIIIQKYIFKSGFSIPEQIQHPNIYRSANSPNFVTSKSNILKHKLKFNVQTVPISRTVFFIFTSQKRK